MKPERRKKIRLGELLIEQKVINEAQLTQALSEQKKTGRKLGRVLTDLGIVQEQQLNDALARHLQIPFVDLRQLTLDQPTVRLLPEALARRFRALVLKSDAGSDGRHGRSTDLFVYDELVAELKQPLRIALVREPNCCAHDGHRVPAHRADRLDRARRSARSCAPATSTSRSSRSTSSSDAPVIRLIQTIFHDAVNARASDVHIEAGRGRVARACASTASCRSRASRAAASRARW